MATRDDGLIIGLTGGIGSGKSTIAEQFARLGAAIVDTDIIAHELTSAHGRAMASIRTHFGEAVIAQDGSLDRAATRARVFADPAQRKALEDILHPMIRDESARLLKHAAVGGAPYSMLVVPLLFETFSYRRIVHRTLSVDCSVDTQMTRVANRSGLSPDEIKRIIASQIPRAFRLQLADDVLLNEGDLSMQREAVAALHLRYSSHAG